MSLTMSLWLMSCGTWEVIRPVQQSFELGSVALDVCRSSQNMSCIQELKDQVLSIAGVLVETSYGSYERVGSVVVFGEASENTMLNDVIREVLREQYTASSVEQMMRSKRGRDAAYAASRGLAQMMWELADLQQERARAELR